MGMAFRDLPLATGAQTEITVNLFTIMVKPGQVLSKPLKIAQGKNFATATAREFLSIPIDQHLSRGALVGGHGNVKLTQARDVF